MFSIKWNATIFEWFKKMNYFYYSLLKNLFFFFKYWKIWFVLRAFHQIREENGRCIEVWNSEDYYFECLEPSSSYFKLPLDEWKFVELVFYDLLLEFSVNNCYCWTHFSIIKIEELMSSSGPELFGFILFFSLN